MVVVVRCQWVVFLCSIILVRQNHALSLSGLNRRRALARIGLSSSTAFLLWGGNADKSVARNLPESNGADLSKTGSVETLVPIVRMRASLQKTRQDLSSMSSSSDDDNVWKKCQGLPTLKETDFKRLFDEYSFPVSYKQRYLDQNAFLVYYTKGFDGPNRPSIETPNDPNETMQTLQFGYRNDAWIAYRELLEEIEYAKKSGDGDGDDSPLVSDVLELVDKTVEALDNYLALAPTNTLQEAQSIVSQ